MMLRIMTLKITMAGNMGVSMMSKSIRGMLLLTATMTLLAAVGCRATSDHAADEIEVVAHYSPMIRLPAESTGATIRVSVRNASMLVRLPLQLEIRKYQIAGR